MTEEQTPKGGSSRKGPSLAAMAALTTLAMALWLNVELSSALFRSVLVFLGMSLLLLLYRVILGHYFKQSQMRAQQQFLAQVQREAELESSRSREEQSRPSGLTSSQGKSPKGSAKAPLSGLGQSASVSKGAPSQVVPAGKVTQGA